MHRAFAIAAVLVLLCLGSLAQANITIDTVPVGDVGNQADTRYETPGYGSVGYNYNIGKYEVTAGQYTAFLNAVAATDTYGLYDTAMGSNSYGCKIQRTGTSGSYTYSVAYDWANRPVNYVSYWDSCRFANWLGNGQGNGDTETGAYTLDGYNGTDGRTIQRNAGATWAVTSEDEWYKAAYYKGGGPNAGYWDYPTSSDTAPGWDMADASGNNANYYSYTDGYLIGSPYYRTEVGEFQDSDGPCGTFDQGGNVWEWNETMKRIGTPPPGTTAYRGMRGGSYCIGDSVGYLLAEGPGNRAGSPSYGTISVGFRVSAVPEPSSLLVLGSGLIPLLALRRRRTK